MLYSYFRSLLFILKLLVNYRNIRTKMKFKQKAKLMAELIKLQLLQQFQFDLISRIDEINNAFANRPD